MSDRALERAADLLAGVLEPAQQREVDRRVALVASCPTPADLAAHLDETIVRTPAFDLVSSRLAETFAVHDGRLTISMPPQQMKTTIARWTVFWLLLRNPDERVVFASFAMGLARRSGRAIRNLVEMYGEPYGLRLDRAHHDASDWSLEGFRGGVFSAGAGQPGSQLTGTPADSMVLDDLLSGEGAAHSVAAREAVETWWESTARVRMRPGAPVVAIGTRWSEQDILSRFIEEGWARINIPAAADSRVLDSVDHVEGARTVDGYLVSTRGTTPADWETITRESGPRAWSALFMGAPAPLEGGVFKQAWFDDHRVAPDEVPPLVEIAVGVDPADTGTGDEAGVLVAGRAGDGQLYVLGDYSGMLSQAQWARTTCMAWLENGAAKVVLERTMGMRSSIPDAWAMLRRQARALLDAGTVAAAAVLLAGLGDEASADEAHLVEVEPWIDDVLSRPSTGPRVEAVTPKQSKLVRAQSITGLFETGRCHIVGRLPPLEHECVTWVATSRHSPARIDTLAHLLTRLDASRAPASLSTPVGAPRVPARAGGGRPRGGFRAGVR